MSGGTAPLVVAVNMTVLWIGNNTTVLKRPLPVDRNTTRVKFTRFNALSPCGVSQMYRAATSKIIRQIWTPGGRAVGVSRSNCYRTNNIDIKHIKRLYISSYQS